MKSDFEKIIEVTRMAKQAATEQNKIGAPGQTLEQALLCGARCLFRANSNLRYIQNMFEEPNNQIIVMRWYNTVTHMRTI